MDTCTSTTNGGNSALPEHDQRRGGSNTLETDAGSGRLKQRVPRLKITEIFYSLQGETSTVGVPTVFVRLTGCPLRCQYCDTAYAFNGGQWYSLPDLLTVVTKYAPSHVTVTGGEPLAQPAVLPFLTALCDQGYRVSLETSGALDICSVDARVVRIIDFKTPGSGELARNRYENIAFLNAHDEVKFVLCDRRDYDWARSFIETHQLIGRCTLLFSPSDGQLNPTELAEWILADRLPVRFQIQLHKYLWPTISAGK